MCCNSLFSCLLFSVVTIFLCLVGVKMANSNVTFEINKDPVIFSISVLPLTTNYHYVLSTDMTVIGNIQFIHKVYEKGGGELTVLWSKN